MTPRRNNFYLKARRIFSARVAYKLTVMIIK